MGGWTDYRTAHGFDKLSPDGKFQLASQYFAQTVAPLMVEGGATQDQMNTVHRAFISKYATEMATQPRAPTTEMELSGVQQSLHHAIHHPIETVSHGMLGSIVGAIPDVLSHPIESAKRLQVSLGGADVAGNVKHLAQEAHDQPLGVTAAKVGGALAKGIMQDPEILGLGALGAAFEAPLAGLAAEAGTAGALSAGSQAAQTGHISAAQTAFDTVTTVGALRTAKVLHGAVKGKAPAPDAQPEAATGAKAEAPPPPEEGPAFHSHAEDEYFYQSQKAKDYAAQAKEARTPPPGVDKRAWAAQQAPVLDELKAKHADAMARATAAHAQLNIPKELPDEAYVQAAQYAATNPTAREEVRHIIGEDPLNTPSEIATAAQKLKAWHAEQVDAFHSRHAARRDYLASDTDKSEWLHMKRQATAAAPSKAPPTETPPPSAGALQAPPTAALPSTAAPRPDFYAGHKGDVSVSPYEAHRAPNLRDEKQAKGTPRTQAPRPSSLQQTAKARALSQNLHDLHDQRATLNDQLRELMAHRSAAATAKERARTPESKARHTQAVATIDAKAAPIKEALRHVQAGITRDRSAYEAARGTPWNRQSGAITPHQAAVLVTLVAGAGMVGYALNHPDDDMGTILAIGAGIALSSLELARGNSILRRTAATVAHAFDRGHSDAAHGDAPEKAFRKAANPYRKTVAYASAVAGIGYLAGWGDPGDNESRYTRNQDIALMVGAAAALVAAGHQYLHASGMLEAPALADHPDVTEAIYQHQGTIGAINQAAKHVADAVRKVATPEAITHGDLLFALESPKEFAALSPNNQAAATMLKTMYESLGKRAVGAGALKGLLENYAPHIFDLSDHDTAQALDFLKSVNYYGKSGRLQERKIKMTLRELVSKPVTIGGKEINLKVKSLDAVRVANSYAVAIGKEIADHEMTRQLIHQKVFRVKPEKDVFGSYVDLEGAPSLTQVTREGKTLRYAVPQEIAVEMKTLLTRSSPTGLVRSLGALSSFAKSLDMVGSLMHATTLGMLSFVSQANKNALADVATFAKGNAHPLAIQWAHDGLTLATGDLKEGLVPQGIDKYKEGITRRAAAFGKLPEKSIRGLAAAMGAPEHLTFEILLPALKINAAENYVSRAVHALGRDATPEELTQLRRDAAKATNTLFGGTNWALEMANARTRFSRNAFAFLASSRGAAIARIFEFAPDWLYSSLALPATALGVRGASAFGRRAAIGYTVKSIVGASALAYATAQATGGTWSPDDPFAIHYSDGRVVSIAKHIGEALHLAKNPVQFAVSKAGPAPRAFVSMNEATFGKGEPLDRAVKALGQIMPSPIALHAFPDDPDADLDRFLGFIGFPVRKEQP